MAAPKILTQPLTVVDWPRLSETSLWAPSFTFHPAAEIRDHCTVRTTSTVPTFFSTTIIHRRTNGVVDREFRLSFLRIPTHTNTRLNFSCQKAPAY